MLRGSLQTFPCAGFELVRSAAESLVGQSLDEVRQSIAVARLRKLLLQCALADPHDAPARPVTAREGRCGEPVTHCRASHGHVGVEGPQSVVLDGHGERAIL